MSDDWSIEKIKDDEDAFLKGLFIHEQNGYYFHEQILETLRKKLIADIQMELYSKDAMEFNHGIVAIINRHFGVER